MKTKTINQEILLMTTTTFACRDWCEKDVQGSKALSAGEQLEEACWNGCWKSCCPASLKNQPREKSYFSGRLFNAVHF